MQLFPKLAQFTVSLTQLVLCSLIPELMHQSIKAAGG